MLRHTVGAAGHMGTAPLSLLGALAAAVRFLPPAGGGAPGHNGVDEIGSVHVLHVENKAFERLGGTGRSPAVPGRRTPTPRPCADIPKLIPQAAKAAMTRLRSAYRRTSGARRPSRLRYAPKSSASRISSSRFPLEPRRRIPSKSADNTGSAGSGASSTAATSPAFGTSTAPWRARRAHGRPGGFPGCTCSGRRTARGREFAFFSPQLLELRRGDLSCPGPLRAPVQRVVHRVLRRHHVHGRRVTPPVCGGSDGGSSGIHRRRVLRRRIPAYGR